MIFGEKAYVERAAHDFFDVSQTNRVEHHLRIVRGHQARFRSHGKVSVSYIALTREPYGLWR